MFDTKSDYALNKLNPDAIVYKSATGVPIRLTREDFASEEEFQRWEAWSDSDYHNTENAEHIHSNHTLPMQEPSETALAVSSPEDALIEVQEQQERQELRRLLMTGLDDCLTHTTASFYKAFSPEEAFRLA